MNFGTRQYKLVLLGGQESGNVSSRYLARTSFLSVSVGHTRHWTFNSFGLYRLYTRYYLHTKLLKDRPTRLAEILRQDIKQSVR